MEHIKQNQESIENSASTPLETIPEIQHIQATDKENPEKLLKEIQDMSQHIKETAQKLSSAPHEELSAPAIPLYDEQPKSSSKPGFFSGLFKKVALITGLGLTTMSAQATEKDSTIAKTGKPTTTEVKGSTKESLKQISFSRENQKAESLTLVGKLNIPMNDPDIEVVILGLTGDEHATNKIDQINAAIKKLGYTPASAELAERAMDEHGMNLVKSISSVMATGEYYRSNDDTNPTETISIKKDSTGINSGEARKGGNTTVAIVANIGNGAKFQSREIGSDTALEQFKYTEYGYLAYRLKSPTTAQYADGIAKVK